MPIPQPDNSTATSWLQLKGNAKASVSLAHEPWALHVIKQARDNSVEVKGKPGLVSTSLCVW